MKLGVIGSRKFTNSTQMSRYLLKKLSISAIITGDAKGADQHAKEFARSQNISLECYPNDKEAIVNNSDVIVAFWDGKSTGTQEVLRLAKRAGKRIEVVFLEERQTASPFGYFAL